MCRSGNLSDALEHLDIRRAVIEIIIAHQTTKRLSAGHAEFFFVKLLEQRALIPRRAFETLERLGRIFFRDVHHPDFQVLACLRVVDEIMQSAPRTFECFEIVMMKDEVDLLGELAVNFRDDRLNGLDGVVGNERRSGQRLLRELVQLAGGDVLYKRP